MNDSELCETLRHLTYLDMVERPLYTKTAYINYAVDLIEEKQEKIKEQEAVIKEKEINLKELKILLKDAVNELCYQCGKYKYEHNGSCDRCKWKDMR